MYKFKECTVIKQQIKKKCRGKLEGGVFLEVGGKGKKAASSKMNGIKNESDDIIWEEIWKNKYFRKWEL